MAATLVKVQYNRQEHQVVDSTSLFAKDKPTIKQHPSREGVCGWRVGDYERPLMACR